MNNYPSKIINRASATKTIIVLNCLVAVIALILPLLGYNDWVHEILPLRIYQFLGGAWWEFFTTMWVHAPFYGIGIFHIVFNMMTLSVFGRFIERQIGIPRYLSLYFGSGFIATIFFIAEALIRANVLDNSQLLDVEVMGASGAVCGIVGAFAIFSPGTKLYLMLIPIPIKAIYAVYGLLVVSLLLLFTSYATIIAHSAHIGGLLTGMAYAWLLLRKTRANHSVQDPNTPPDWEEFLKVSQMSDDEIHQASLPILRKVTISGIISLNSLERKILQRLNAL